MVQGQTPPHGGGKPMPKSGDATPKPNGKAPSGPGDGPIRETPGTKPDIAGGRPKSPAGGEKTPSSGAGGKAKSAAGDAVKGAAAKKAPVVGDAATALGKSKSDGSAAGDAKDIAARTKAGAQVGKMAGGYGAAIGGAIGAGVGVLKSKKAKKTLLLLLIAPLLLLLVGGAMIGVALGSVTQNQEQAAREESNAQQAATADGLNAADVAKYMLWSGVADVDWTLVAAADRSAGDWSGPGDPILGIDDRDKFNAEAKKYHTTEIGENADWNRTVNAWGELVNAKVDAEPGRANASEVAAGAVGFDADGKTKIVPQGDGDAEAIHNATKQSITKVLGEMPTSTSDDADQIWDHAWRWATGQPPPQANAEDCQPSDPGGAQVDTSGVDVGGLTRKQIDTAALVISGAKEVTPDPAAWTIALMVVGQESAFGSVTNATGAGGDTGPFQQRSLVGWYADGATQAENAKKLEDPRYGVKIFLQGRTITTADVDNAKKAGQEPAGGAGYKIPGLFDIKGWEAMEPTVAAQKVQRSAFPDAYAKHEKVAKDLIQKLEGVDVVASAGVDPGNCAGTGGSMKDCPPTAMKAVENPPQLPEGISPDALRTLRCGVKKFPFVKTVYSWAPPVPPSNADDHSQGRALDFMLNDLSPGDYAPKSEEEKKKYDEIVAWMMKDHKELGVEYIIWQNRIFNFDRDSGTDFYAASRPYSFCSPPKSSPQSCGPTLAHFNHIHVSFYGNKGTGYPEEGGGGQVVGGWTLWTDKPYAMGAGICNGASSCQGYSSHTGQDVSLGGGEGSPILAAAGGKVTTKLFCPTMSNAQRRSNGSCSYGRLVTIDHGGGVVTYYAHLNDYGPGIADGTVVKPGQVIGFEGEQGHAQGSHLHFEVRVQGSIVDPNDYLAKKGIDPRCDKLATTVDSRINAGKCSK